MLPARPNIPLSRRLRYWRVTGRLTAALFMVWLLVTFVSAWFARELNEFTVIGPLGFYMGAQGALLVYLGVVWWYARRMDAIDRAFGVVEEEEP